MAAMLSVAMLSAGSVATAIAATANNDNERVVLKVIVVTVINILFYFCLFAIYNRFLDLPNVFAKIFRFGVKLLELAISN